MKRTYKLNQRLAAYILLVALLLQSCGGYPNQFMPKGKGQANDILRTGKQIEITKQLVEQKFTSTGWEVTDLYEEQDELKVQAIERHGTFTSKPYNFSVRIASDIDLEQVSRLSRKEQERFVHFNSLQNEQSSHIIVSKRGLLGGVSRRKLEELKKKQEAIWQQEEARRKAEEEIKEKKLQKERKKKERGKRESEDNLSNYQRLLKLAIQGNVEAQFKLGQGAYTIWQNLSNEKSAQEARKWLEKASIQHHEGAIALLQEMNAATRPATQLKKLKEEEKGPTEGTDAGINEQGYQTDEGNSTQRFYKEGKKKEDEGQSANNDLEYRKDLLERARKGEDKAQFELGEWAYNAWQRQNPEGDIDEALHWLIQAKAQDYLPAINLLQEIKKAHPEAEKDKENGKEKGDKVEDNFSNYEDLLECAIQGDSEAQFMLGKRSYEIWFYQYREESCAEAKVWLSKAAAQSHQGAISLLDKMEEREQKEELDIEFKNLKAKFKSAYRRLRFNTFLPAIPEQEIKIHYNKRLGAGGAGIVYQATYQGELVAIKQLLHTSNKQIAAFQGEAIVMANHRHKNIATFLGFCPSQIAFLMEYVPGGSLWDLLENSKNKSWDSNWQQRYQIALDVAEGMNYLHDCDIVHCDLKSKNILLDYNGRAKVTDFGAAALRTENYTYGEWESGTYGWMAPEIFHIGKNTKAGDVYSYGMVLWQLGARKEPFKEVNKIYDYVKAGNHEVISDDTPQELKKIIELCWLPEPPLKKETDNEQRPTMKQVRYLLEAGHPDFIDKEKEELLSRLEESNEEKEHLARQLEGSEQLKANIEAEKEEIYRKLQEEYGRNQEASLVLKKRLEELKEKENACKKLQEELESKQAELSKLQKEQDELLIERKNLISQVEDLDKDKVNEQKVELKRQFEELKVWNDILNKEKVELIARLEKLEDIIKKKVVENVRGKDEGSLENEGNTAANKEKELIHLTELELEDIIKEWPSKPGHRIGKGKEILARLKSTGESLDLSKLVLTSDLISILIKHTRFNQIHILDLRRNKLGDTGVQFLAKALPATKIHTLYLDHNQVCSKGMQELVKALPSSSIHTLHLNNNRIVDKEVLQELAKILPSTPIQILSLQYQTGFMGNRQPIDIDMQRLLKQQNPNVKVIF